ncbi:protease SohB [Gammaproteobacteria bacterium]|nr:protease SohB [Gammaproteobacteria bacterium]
MSFFDAYGLFLAKIVTVVVAIAMIIAIVSRGASRQKRSGHIDARSINTDYEQARDTVCDALISEPEDGRLKRLWTCVLNWTKRDKSDDSQHPDSETEKPANKPAIYVLDFDGDINASDVEELRSEIDAVISAKRDGDEVLLRLESSGGTINGYGLAAAQLARLRDREIPLTIAVDRVAASGGYMMAVVANHIVAAPFAMIGSIGVIAQLPNFNKLLKEHNIDYEQFTAGEYKRTVTMFGENTDEGRQKLRDDLTEIHEQFKRFIQRYRPDMDIDANATGEVWLGDRARDLGLVDALSTSDDWLLERVESHQLISVAYTRHKTFSERLPWTMQSERPRWLQQLPIR